MGSDRVSNAENAISALCPHKFSADAFDSRQCQSEQSNRSTAVGDSLTRARKGKHAVCRVILSAKDPSASVELKPLPVIVPVPETKRKPSRLKDDVDAIKLNVNPPTLQSSYCAGTKSPRAGHTLPMSPAVTNAAKTPLTLCTVGRFACNQPVTCVAVLTLVTGPFIANVAPLRK